MLSIHINFLIINFHFSFNQINICFLLYFSFILFIIGLLGSFYNKQNLLIILLCIEIMLLSVGLNFVFMNLLINKYSQIYTLFIITTAAAESSIGLGLLIVMYRLKQTINFEKFIRLV